MEQRNKMARCKHLGDLLKAETPIIKRHFSRHKWFQHIREDEEAKVDFIEKYGFIMREMYCGYICDDRINCPLAKEYLPESMKDKPLYEQLELNLLPRVDTSWMKGYNEWLENTRTMRGPRE